MKFIQTDNQIVIKMDGGSQVVIGTVFALVGIGAGIGGFKVPKKSTANVTVSPHAGLILSLFGLLFFAIGVFVLLTARNRQTTIVKAGDTTVSSKRLLGGHQVQQSIPTSSIIGVRLATYLSNTGVSNTNMNNNLLNSGGNTNNQRQSQLTLVLQNNDLLEVAQKSSSGGFSVNGMNVGNLIMKAPLSNEAQQLATFLNVPLDSTDMSSLGGAIKTIKNEFMGGGQPTVNSAPQTTPTFNAAPIQPAATPTTTVQPPTFVQPQAAPPAAQQPVEAAAPALNPPQNQ